MDRVRNVRTSNSKIDKTPDKMSIASRVRKRITIRSTKREIELHGSLNSTLIRKSGTRKKILNVSFLGNKESIGSGGNLNPKKITKRTKIRHEKLLTQTSLNKGDILRVVTSDDHVINIEKKKSATTRRTVNKQSRIMSTGGETSSSDYRSKALKPGTRGLLEAIERATKTANHAICNRITRWWLHINLLTQLTIKKGILDIKLRHRPMANRGHSEKSPNSGHVSHRSKRLIIITTMLLLKTTSYKTSFVALKCPIRTSLNLIDPLTRDRTNLRRKRNNLPRAGALKRSNLLSHGKLPLRMDNSLTVSGRLRNGQDTVGSRIIRI